MVVGGGGQATKAGIWIEGAHIVASDNAFDDYMSNQESAAASGLVLVHFCVGSPCGVRSRSTDAACHSDTFRLLSAQDALKLPWAKEQVKDFYDNLAATKSAGDQSGESDVAGAAVDGITGAVKQSMPTSVPEGDVNAANAAWSAALGKSPPGGHGAGQSQQQLDQELATKLAAAAY